MPEAKTEPAATRQAYGDALVALGEAHEDVVALDADLAVSTQSMKFGKKFPERFFNCGAAEANMMSMACGLAVTGKVPYASTFAIFASGRAYDQVRRHRPQRAEGADRSQPRRCLARGGRRLASDDRGRCSDARRCHGCRSSSRPTTTSPTAPSLSPTSGLRSRSTCGLAAPRRRSSTRRSRRRSATASSCARARTSPSSPAGDMVWRALDAADTLAKEDGVEAEVLNVAIIKPLDTDAVVESLAKTGVGVTAEEHRVAGGLADAVREAAAEEHPVPIFALGMGDEFAGLWDGRGLGRALRPDRRRDHRPRPGSTSAQADRVAPADPRRGPRLSRPPCLDRSCPGENLEAR